MTQADRPAPPAPDLTTTTTRQGETIHLGGGAGTRHERDTTGFTIWFTGLSGSGKSTIAHILEGELRKRGHRVEVLDGDVVRTNLSKGLGFSKEDRDTNILRIGWVCEILSRNDVVAIGAAISPYREIREQIRANVGRFVEVYVEAPLEVLADRDVKGLYRKAMAGEIQNFTGVNDPYEAPLNPEVVCHSDGSETPEESAAKVLAKLAELGYSTPV
jgi:adenylyl-sulfate kinase